MRCPSCGIENAPDSRFCGGCGARMPNAHSLVAPTQKMSDDTPYQQRGQQEAEPHSIPPQNIQRNMQRRVSQPPQMPAPGEAVRAVTTRPGPGSPPPATVHDRPSSEPSRGSSHGATPPAGSLAHRPRALTPAESAAAAPSGGRWNLILFVLLIDLGLAGAGAWMLSRGLAN